MRRASRAAGRAGGRLPASAARCCPGGTGLVVGPPCRPGFTRTRVQARPCALAVRWPLRGALPRPLGRDSGAPPGPVQVMSIEEVERILDETQEAVEYQRVGAAPSGPPSPASRGGCRLGGCPWAALEGGACPCLVVALPSRAKGLESRRLPCSAGEPPQPPARPASPRPPLPQQIDELLAGSLTQEDEDAILEELNEITQVAGPPGQGACPGAPARPGAGPGQGRALPQLALGRTLPGGQDCGCDPAVSFPARPATLVRRPACASPAGLGGQGWAGESRPGGLRGLQGGRLRLWAAALGLHRPPPPGPAPQGSWEGRFQCRCSPWGVPVHPLVGPPPARGHRHSWDSRPTARRTRAPEALAQPRLWTRVSGSLSGTQCREGSPRGSGRWGGSRAF